MKKFISLIAVLAISFSFTVAAYAAGPEKADLTPEQQAVINSYENNIAVSVDNVVLAARSGVSATAAYRGSLYRGSVLMWTKDWIEWATSGSTVTSSTAWQEAGYIFPNIARATGITKHSTTSSSVTYRASKTIGAGVVTPWGDVTVYEQDFTDFLRGNANGTMDTW
jgi:hypothetical protein